MDHPFSDAEKRWVLSEAVRTSSIPTERLLQIVLEGNIIPAWTEMLLPHGRNVNQCIEAFDNLRNSFLHQRFPPNLSIPPPQSLIATSGPSAKRRSDSFEPSSAGPTPKRRQSGADPIALARTIQPKPSSNGSPKSFSPLVGGQQPKKRGRPSKADVEARNAEAIAKGEVLPPPKPPGPKNPQITPFDPRSSTQNLAPSPRMLAPSLSVGGEVHTGYFPASTAGQNAPYAPMMGAMGLNLASPRGVSQQVQREDSGESEGLTTSSKKIRFRPGLKPGKTSKPGESSFQTPIDSHLGHVQSLVAPPTSEPPQAPQEQPMLSVRPEEEQPPYPADIPQLPLPQPDRQPPLPPSSQSTGI